MRPFGKACAALFAISAVIGGGVPTYSYIAQERILSTQTAALLERGWKLEHLPQENTVYSFYNPMMTLQNVKLVHEQTGSSWTAQTVSVPLLPFLPMKVKGLEGLLEGKRVQIDSASGMLTSHGWSDMRMQHVTVSQAGSNTWSLEAASATAGGMEGSSWLDVQARDVSLREGGSRLDASKLEVDRVSHEGSPFAGMSKAVAAGVALDMAPEDRRRAMVPFPVARSFRVSSMVWSSELGGRGMHIHMTGVGASAGSNAIVDGSVMRDEDGTKMTWKMEGPGVPQMFLTLRGDSANEGLDAFMRQPLLLKGKLEITDPSGVMRDALLTASGYRGAGDLTGKSRAEVALPVAMVRNGLIDRGSGVAMLNWIRDASRTLVVDISGIPGKPPMSASLTR